MYYLRKDHQTWELVGIDGRLGGFVIEAGCLHLRLLGCCIDSGFTEKCFKISGNFSDEKIIGCSDWGKKVASFVFLVKCKFIFVPGRMSFSKKNRATVGSA